MIGNFYGDALTLEEHGMFSELLKVWSKRLARNHVRMEHYEGKTNVKDLGISIPKPIATRLSRCSMMWSKQAVDRVADSSVIDGFDFGAFPYLADVVDANELSDQYDEVVPSTRVHGCSMWTVTAGDTGEPPVIISSYDAEHAAALYDYRHRRTLAGVTIVDVDIHDRTRPTAVNFHSPDGSIVEAYVNRSGQWTTRRRNSGVGRCSMVVMRNDPNKRHPYGRSAITPAIESLEDEANREAVRMVMAAELGTAVTRWVMGADDGIFENGRWEAYLGSIFALPRDTDGDVPQTGQYPQGSMEPHVSYIRQLANQFASEAHIPIHSLLYTEANPASAEAIEASKSDLIEQTRKANRLNGATLRKLLALSASIVEEMPVSELDMSGVGVRFRNPEHPTLAASADAASKTAADVPGFAGTRTYWRMKGYQDAEIERIQAECAANTTGYMPQG